jgi:hypothetical protein
MSGNTKKRAAEQPLPNQNKRASTRKVNEPDIIVVEDDKNYHISITIHSKFNAFPASLRATLQDIYVATVKDHMKTLEGDKATPNSKHTWSIIADTRVRSNPNPRIATEVIKNNIPALCLANTWLLEHFMNTKRRFLEKPTFVSQEAENGETNPTFVQLHSVRKNEIGWGYDAKKCLSLYLVFVKDTKLYEHALFVQQTEIKIENA